MKLHYITVSLAILATPALAQFDPAAAQLALQQGLASTHASAAQAAVVRNGQVVWQGATGTREIGDATPINNDTLFGLASVGKTYASTMALRLVDQGLLSLDAPISTYLPSGVPGASNVTTRMLLNHTAGYTDLYTIPEVQTKIADSNYPWTRSELLSYVSDPDAPGTQFSYSNTNYILLGEVLERASAQSVSSLFESNITTPLGLERTFVDRQSRDQYAIGSLLSAGVVSSAFDTTIGVPTSLHGAAFLDGGIAANATETAVFFDSLVGGELLSPALTAQMLEFGPDSGYGLGIQTLEYNGRQYVGHVGIWLGFSALAFYQPELDATIVILTNGESFDGLPPAVVVFDSLSQVIIPAPGSLSLLAAAGFMVARRRR